MPDAHPPPAADRVAVLLEVLGRSGSVRLHRLEHLAGSDRAVVVRATVDGPDGVRSVVAKFPDPRHGSGGVREQAALDVLRDVRAPHVPRLVAARAEPPLLVLEDVGRGASLADRLRGTDAGAARDAVLAWAGAVAELQVAGVRAGVGPAFTDRLSRLSVLGAPPADTSVETTASAAEALRRILPELGVHPPADALEALRRIGAALAADPARAGGPWALVPGDTCPDNNAETADGLVLLDFEHAEARHVAWEAAYLTVPWPTCWCSWRLPDEVAAAALARWRSLVAPALDDADAAALDRAVLDATVAWALVGSAWLLRSALDGDPPAADPRRPRPTRRALIQHRLGLVAARTPSAALQTLAEEALAAVGRLWGDHPLGVAPAFR